MFQKFIWPFTVWINCSSDLKRFANSWPSALNFKVFLDHRRSKQFWKQNITYMTDRHFAPQNTLLLERLCSLRDFAPWETLLPRTFYSSKHFAPWNTLPLNSVCSLEHFASQHTLVPETLCSLKHSAPWNTLLLETLCSLYHFTPW